MSALSTAKIRHRTSSHRRRKRPQVARVQTVLKSTKPKTAAALPLWLAVNAEGAEDRIFAWKALRGFE
jgi:hypothetical protein